MFISFWAMIAPEMSRTQFCKPILTAISSSTWAMQYTIPDALIKVLITTSSETFPHKWGLR
jgi:hypothetical protein